MSWENWPSWGAPAPQTPRGGRGAGAPQEGQSSQKTYVTSHRGGPVLSLCITRTNGQYSRNGLPPPLLIPISSPNLPNPRSNFTIPPFDHTIPLYHGEKAILFFTVTVRSRSTRVN